MILVPLRTRSSQSDSPQLCANFGFAALGGAMSIDDDKPEVRRGFFGRRKGHRLRANQAAVLETLLPRLALPVNAPPHGDLTQLFPVPVDEVRCEIGFGGGEY